MTELHKASDRPGSAVGAFVCKLLKLLVRKPPDELYNVCRKPDRREKLLRRRIALSASFSASPVG
jgi:hypothetical protein